MSDKNKSLKKRIKDKDPKLEELLPNFIIKNGLIKCFITLLIIVVSILFLNNVSNLSVISPNVFFIIAFIVAIYLIVNIIYFLLERKTSLNNLLRIYHTYDTLSFTGVLLVIISFVILFVFCPTIVDGQSMESSFYSGDRVLVWHMFYTPKTDDVVIINVSDKFMGQYTEERFFIKRVVATSGDKIYYQNNSFYVNDNLVSDSISPNQFETMTTYKDKSILNADNTIISGYSIVLGDNRSISKDSRSIGAINNNEIEGKVFFRFYSKKATIGIPKKNIRY